MTERLAWDEYFAAQALLIAIVPLVNVPKWAQLHNKVISTGYNGSVSGTSEQLY